MADGCLAGVWELPPAGSLQFVTGVGAERRGINQKTQPSQKVKPITNWKHQKKNNSLQRTSSEGKTSVAGIEVMEIGEWTGGKTTKKATPCLTPPHKWPTIKAKPLGQLLGNQMKWTSMHWYVGDGIDGRHRQLNPTTSTNHGDWKHYHLITGCEDVK